MNSQRNLLLSMTALVAGALVLSPSPAQATLVTVDQVIYQSVAGTLVAPSLLTGTLDISVSGSTLTILMTNTSVDEAFVGSGAPATMLLTGFGLQLPGVDILSGVVSVNGGSAAVNFDVGQNTTIISNQYLYANASI